MSYKRVASRSRHMVSGHHVIGLVLPALTDRVASVDWQVNNTVIFEGKTNAVKQSLPCAFPKWPMCFSRFFCV